MAKVKNKTTLKGLQTQLEKAKGEYESAKNEVKESQDKCGRLKEKINRLSQKIEQLKDKGPVTITEHAQLRYIERVLGFDLGRVKESIITNKVQSMIDTLGDGDYPIGDGYYVKVKNNTAITIYES